MIMNIELTPALKEKYDERLTKLAGDYCRLRNELMMELYGDVIRGDDYFDMKEFEEALKTIIRPYIDKATYDVINEMENGV